MISYQAFSGSCFKRLKFAACKPLTIISAVEACDFKFNCPILFSLQNLFELIGYMRALRVACQILAEYRLD